jgi:hypothetical protein
LRFAHVGFGVAQEALVLGRVVGPRRSYRRGGADRSRLLGAGVALHPALALILDRERDVQTSYREKYDALTGLADGKILSDNRTRAMGELRLALDRGKFELVYQPQFDLATGGNTDWRR